MFHHGLQQLLDFLVLWCWYTAYSLADEEGVSSVDDLLHPG